VERPSYYPRLPNSYSTIKAIEEEQKQEEQKQ